MTSDSKSGRRMETEAKADRDNDSAHSSKLTANRPSLSTFVESATSRSTLRPDLIEICLAHQEQSWSSGVRSSVEQVAELFAIKDHTQASDALMALICNEVYLREDRGESPTLVEYQARFPQLADMLRTQWEINVLLTFDQPATVPSQPQTQKVRLIDRYEIVAELGRGAMGVVYLAWDPQLKRQIALKRLRTGADSSAEEVMRILTEAEAIAQIQHPSIVKIYDLGEVDELPYLAMEYCEGGTLAKRLDGKPIQPKTAAELIKKICGGVSAAHKRRIIHRDLKPKNILLEGESDWNPKISDFGLAKMLDSDAAATTTGNVLGTPAYMSPEQAFGDAKRVGPTADVYSLGAILYECLTGRPPFVGVTAADILQQVRHRQPISVRQLEPHVPKDLETITQKCLRKEPHLRYATVSELHEDIERYLNGQPILARRERWYEAAVRSARKHPLVTGLTTASALLLIAVTVVSVVFAKSIMDANARIRKSEASAQLGKANALISGAHGIRVTREPGQRFEALASLREAARIGRELNQPIEWYENLRDEAIGALVLPDAHIAAYRSEPRLLKYSDFSDDHRLLALSFDSGPISIRRLSDHQELLAIPRLDEVVMLSFIGNDRVLLFGKPSGKVELWNIANSQPERLWLRESAMEQFKMSRDKSIFVVENARIAEVIKVSDGSTLASFSTKPYTRDPMIALHPTHPFLVICSKFEPGIELRNWQTGETIFRYRLETDDYAKFTGAAWSNDGRRLATVSSHGQALLWFRFNPNTGELKLERKQQPSPDQSGGEPRICFSANDDRLLVLGWNNSLGLIDSNLGLPIFSSNPAYPTAGEMPSSDPQNAIAGVFAESGNAHRIGMMSISHGNERTFLVPEQDKGGTFAVSDPTGRCLAFALGERFSIVDVATKKLLMTKQWRGLAIESLAFDDRYLYFNSTGICFRMPFKIVNEPVAELILGVPERLHIPASGISGLAASRDGKTIATSCYDGYTSVPYAGCWLKTSNEPAGRKIVDRVSGFGASVSGDGESIGFATKYSSMIYSQRVGKVERVASFKEPGQVAFSDEGKSVWVAPGVLRTDDWELQSRSWEGALFDVSPDGKQVSSNNAKGVVSLADARSGKVFARIQGHHPWFIPNASKVVAFVDDRHALYDMKLIRQGVLDLGIPWTGPDYADCVEPAPVVEAKFVDEMQNVVTANDLIRVMDEHCEEQAKLNPGDGHLVFAAAMLYLNRRDYTEALERIDRACQLLPDAITPRQWRAYLFADMRRWPEAIADADWVLERIDDTRFRLLRAEWLFRNHIFWRSLADCRAIIESGQDFVSLARGLRYLNHKSLGNVARAWGDRKFFFENIGDDVNSLNDIAYCMVANDISLRQPALAKLCVEKLESLQTEFEPRVRDTIGMVYFRRDEYARAIDYLTPNLADKSNELYASALSVIAMCECKLGNRLAAERHMQDLVSWRPPQNLELIYQIELEQLRAEAQQTLSQTE